jgi:DNA-directed RNA polymerase subunit K/omega
MDFKKIKGEKEAVTRDIRKIMEPTGNLYESVAILSIRANQISIEMKEDLKKKIKDFETTQDSLEEILENREQIEVSKFYERLPKPTLIAIDEFLNGKIYFRNPYKEIQK